MCFPYLFVFFFFFHILMRDVLLMNGTWIQKYHLQGIMTHGCILSVRTLSVETDSNHSMIVKRVTTSPA